MPERLRTKSELKRLFTNLRRKLITDNMMSILIDVLWRDRVQADWEQTDQYQEDFINNKPEIPEEQIQSDWTQADDEEVDFIKNKPESTAVINSLFTGWAPGAWYNECTPSFDDSTLEFTLTPIGDEYTYYVQGVKYTKTAADSFEIADTTGLHFIVYNGATLEEVTVAEWLECLHYKTKCLVAAVYWNATAQKSIMHAAEPHTYTITGPDHLWKHTTIGARYAGGLGLEIASNNWQLDVEEGTILDEDIEVTIQDDTAVIFGQNLTPLESQKLYRSGAAAWLYENATPANIVALGINNRVLRNINTAGTWTSAQINVNQFTAYWAIATNDWANPVVMVMGQGDSGSLVAARAGNDYADMDFEGLPTAEFRLLGRVIVKCISASPYYEIIEIEQMQADDIIPGGSVTNDSYVTGATWDEATDTLTLSRNNGLPAVTVVLPGKPIEVVSLTLVQANWTLVSGLYEYDLANANITATAIVDVIPDNTDIAIVKAAEILPRTESSTGSVKIYSTNEPTDDIGVTINIFEATT